MRQAAKERKRASERSPNPGVLIAGRFCSSQPPHNLSTFERIELGPPQDTEELAVGQREEEYNMRDGQGEVPLSYRGTSPIRNCHPP